MTRTRPELGALLALVLLGAGCLFGGPGSTPTAAPDPPTPTASTPTTGSPTATPPADGPPVQYVVAGGEVPEALSVRFV